MKIQILLFIQLILFNCNIGDESTKILQFSSTRYVVQILPGEILSNGDEHTPTSYRTISLKISMSANGINQEKILGSNELLGVASSYLPSMHIYEIDKKNSALTISGYINASCPAAVSILYFTDETYKILYNGETYGPEYIRIGDKIGVIFPTVNYFGEVICRIPLIKLLDAGKITDDKQINIAFFNNRIQDLKVSIEKEIDNESVALLAYSYFLVSDFNGLKELYSSKKEVIRDILGVKSNPSLNEFITRIAKLKQKIENDFIKKSKVY